MRVTLTVVEGPHVGSTFSFVEHEAFLVGRSPEVQFRLPLRDKTLSRVHFLVEVNPPSCRLMDMASTNGVVVNGKRVLSADLRHGDRIKAGSTVLEFAVEDDEPAEAQPAPEPELSTSSWFIDPASAVETTDWPELKLPGYRIERKLGEGAMGVVHLALREGDGSEVALKVLKPAIASGNAAKGLFLREASVLRKLEHPNIVRFLDIGFASGRLFFAMEYVKGTNLGDILKARGAFSIPAAVGVACQLLRALEYAHAMGFVHRDIKPANILATRKDGRPRAKLADFGLAKLYNESSLSGLSVTGQIGGTLAFMPPEQISHFREARPAADLYSLGATLYTLLAGRPIFDFAGKLHQQVVRILFEEPAPIQSHRPEVPDALARAIHRALAKAPADRFADAKGMRDALSPFAKAP